MIAWLGGAWAVVKSIPTLVSLAKQLWDAYQKFEELRREQELKSAFNKGLEEAKKDHNTQGIEDAINGKKPNS